MSNSSKLVRSAVFGQLPIIMQFISGFIVMPLLIAHFGDRYYGLWILVGSLLGYFGLLDFGFSKAIVRFVSMSLGEDNRDESDKWISVGLILLSVVAMIGFMVLFIGIWSLKYFVIVDINLIRKVILISGSAFLITLPAKNFIGLLYAHVRADIVDSIYSIKNALTIVSFLIALFIKSDFIVFISITAVYEIVCAIVITIYAQKIHGKVVISLSVLNKSNILIFTNYGGYSFIAQVADLFRFQAYPIIISSILGMSAITYYQIANSIRTILGQISNKVLINLTPVFSQIQGRSGIGDELRNAYIFSLKLSTYLVSFIVLFTMIIAPDFIARWMGPKYLDVTILLLISLIGNLFDGIQTPAVCYLFGTSKQKIYAVTNSIEAVLIVVSALLLADGFGLVGMVAGATFSTLLVKTIIQPIIVLKDLEISMGHFYFNIMFINILKPTIFFIVSYFLSVLVLGPTYSQILKFGMINLILFIPYIYIVGFTKSERKQIINSLISNVNHVS